MINLFPCFLRKQLIRPQQLSIEIARITFGICSIIIFQYKQLIISGKQVHEGWNISNYFPKGVLAFLGDTVPSMNTIDVWLFLQLWSAIFLILGLFSRVSLVINFLANLLLISLSESFSVGWSHGYNMNLLAQMPFVFAPVGRLLSVDAIVKKRLFNKVDTYCNNGIYLWMTNFGIVGIFFNAFFWKIFSNRTSLNLNWAFSDNFRNQIISRYSLLGEEIPNYLLFLSNNEWAWQATAFLNLTCQALPFISLFLFKMPRLRLLFGFLFVIEEIGLMAIMQLYDYYWIPLILLFVDWDYFLRKKQHIQEQNGSKIKDAGPVVYIFYNAYMVAYIVLAFQVLYYIFGWKVNSSHGINSYPFSCYSMYSRLIVKNDQGTHKDIGFGVQILNSTKFKNQTEQAQFEYVLHRKFYGYRDLEDSTATFNAIVFLKNYISDFNKDLSIDSLAIKRNVYEYNPVGKPAGVSVYEDACMGLLLNKKFFYLFPKHEIKHDTVFITPVSCGFTPSDVRLKVYNYQLRKTVEWPTGSLAIPLNSSILCGKQVIFILETKGVLNKPVNFSGNIAYL